jgi:hypothetical protein
MTLWRQGWTLVCFIFIIYFLRHPLCNKYSDYIVTFSSIHSIIICVVFFGAYMRCTRLCPLNPGVTNSLVCLGLLIESAQTLSPPDSDPQFRSSSHIYPSSSILFVITRRRPLPSSILSQRFNIWIRLE